MPGARNSASIPTTKGLDADAPFLVESYQHGTDGSTNGQLPSYTYTTDPNSEPQARQPRSWDEASRAKPNPIQPKPKHDAGHVYLNVDSNDSELDVHGGPSDPPAPTNTTITGYATALGWELSKLCALPYIFPPFTSAIVLIWETQNDLVRFHGYQSALASAAVIGACFVLRVFLGWRTLAWLLVRLALLGSWYSGYVDELIQIPGTSLCYGT